MNDHRASTTSLVVSWVLCAVAVVVMVVVGVRSADDPPATTVEFCRKNPSATACS